MIPLATPQKIGLKFSTHTYNTCDVEKILDIRMLSSLYLLTVKGWSISPDIHSRYEDLLRRVSAHLDTHDHLNVFIKFELFNSSTVRYLFVLMKLLNKYHAEERKIRVYWSCNPLDFDMIEIGMDLRDLCDFEFKINYV
jgi:hypothetical protein